MTRTNHLSFPQLSANDAFKLGYPRYLKGALLAALALTALIVWLWPGYQPKPYKLREPQAFEIVDLEPPVDVPLPPVPEAAPVIPRPIEAVPDDDPGIDDLPWEPPGFWDPIEPRPVDPRSYEGFVASSAKPELIQHVKADYPEIARRMGLEGTVVVHALVGPNGTVTDAIVTRGVHPVLDRAAVEAALRCRFDPARQRELKVRAWVSIPYNFRLR